jgi:hypothetical protein
MMKQLGVGEKTKKKNDAKVSGNIEKLYDAQTIEKVRVMRNNV